MPRADEMPLTRRILELASWYGRYGYRRITALLRREGWRVEYNTIRPHSSLGYRPPAPEAIRPKRLDPRPYFSAGNMALALT